VLRVHHADIPSLPWKEIKSPTGKFHARFRNVSLAPGGIRNTGTWGGGHPFDLELQKFLPGESGCPFHSHAARWERYPLLGGSATVRAR